MGASDVLLAVSGAQLHKVEAGAQRPLDAGEFSIAVVSHNVDGGAGADSAVEARVGGTSWELGKSLPSLQAAETIYSFALRDSREDYYVLVLPADTPAEALTALHDVLLAVSALGTAKQLDAAAEEADRLGGGKEAQAIAAAAQADEAQAGSGGSDAAAPAAAPAPATAGVYVLPPSGNPTADRLAAGLLRGSSAVAGMVGRAASATASAISGYAERRIAAGEPTATPAKVSPTLKAGLRVAGAIASSAAYVSGHLAALVGKASYATALAIARSLPGHKGRAKPGEVSQEERGALQTVGAAGLVAFIDVYDSLEAAALQVLGQSADTTQRFIQYKYGDEAGAAAASSVPVAQDMLTATLNFSRLGARAFISKTAKKSAKMYLKATVAGVPLEQQAAGARRPQGMSNAAAAPAQQAAAPAPLAGSTMPPAAVRPGSSSNALAAPYPAGPAAIAATGAVVPGSG